MEYFPFIHLQGSARERGLQHGKLLKDRIHKTIEFYQKVFNRPEEEILERAEAFETVISKVNSEFIIEMEGIAQGAGVDKRWILALNSRSEIITTFVSECTAVYSKQNRLLAQNWDWAEELESLAVMMQIDLDDHSILMMTEPGIIGKIGLNSSGLGVTLNFLHAPGKLQGLPIHIMLRLLLEQKTFEDALDLARSYHSGKGGNIILASENGQYVDLEFANTKLYELGDDPIFLHTNHYLGDDELNTEKEKLASSLARFARSSEFIETTDMLDFIGIKNLLSDQQNSDLPICRPYVFDEEIGNVGTVCSLIMDLPNRSIHYTPGNPFNNDFTKVSI